MRILLVEDNELIARGIVVGLRLHGLEVVHLSDVRSAEASYSDESFDAVILDLGLPDKDGMQLLAFIRAADQAMPILILSARDSIEHRLSGLQSGADDYMIKPFDLRELAARLHVLVRRSQGRATALIKAGPLCMDPENGLAWLNDVQVLLSRRELDILSCLANVDRRWLSAEVLKDRLYGNAEEQQSNALNVHIYNIRQKLGNESIETARGLGYRLGWGLS